MTLSKRDPWADNAASLRTFPDHVLVDIARNDAAQHDYRKLATEVLWNRKSPRIQHLDLQPFVRELEIELDGVIFDHPAPGNPLIASITTESLNANEDVLPALQSEVAVPDPEAEEAAEISPASQAFIGFDEVELVSDPVQTTIAKVKLTISNPPDRTTRVRVKAKEPLVSDRD